MIPLVFSECRGWLHEAPGALGVLLLSAQGFEELAARKSWRKLADALAAQGMPTLRFDYPGCGDSIGDDDAPDRVAAWTASIEAAIATLRRIGGAERVALVGLRLGSLLARQIAASTAVDALCLLAAPANGKSYTRELRAMARVMNMEGYDSGPAATRGDGVTICGFAASKQTLAALEAIDPPPLPAGTPVLLLQHDKVRGMQLAERMRANGATVDQAEFKGYAELMCEPTAARCPDAAWKIVVDWLAARNHGTSKPSREAPPAELRSAMWRETAVVFGADRQRVGVLTRPPGGDAGRTLLIVGNAGGTYHVGWARQTVELARSMAAAGIATLRFDYAGIGDSPDLPERVGSVFYSMDSVDDVSAVLDWAGEAGYQRVVGLGACSSAYQFYHAARMDARMNEAVLVNLQCFEWTPKYEITLRSWQMKRSYVLDAKRQREMNDALANAGASTSDRLLAIVRKTYNAINHRAATLSSLIFAQGRRKVRGEVDAIIARGGRLLFVYSDDDIGLTELELNLGRIAELPRQDGRLDVAIIPNADHTLTQIEARLSLRARLLDFIAAGEDQPRDRGVVESPRTLLPGPDGMPVPASKASAA